MGRQHVLLNSPQWEKSALLPPLQCSQDITSHPACSEKTLKSNGQVPGKLAHRTFSSASHRLKGALIPRMMVGCGWALIISSKSVPLPCFSPQRAAPLLPSRSTRSPTCPRHAAISASLPLLFSAALGCSLIVFLHLAAKGGTAQRHRAL